MNTPIACLRESARFRYVHIDEIGFMKPYLFDLLHLSSQNLRFKIRRASTVIRV